MEGLERGGFRRGSVGIKSEVGEDGVEYGVVWEPGVLLGEDGVRFWSTSGHSLCNY